MTIDIRFPDPPAAPDRVTVPVTVAPEWSPERVAELARAHEIDADVVDLGPWLVVRDERASLEVYQASDSLRYALSSRDGEATEPADLDDDRAVALALDWISRFGTLPVRRDGIRVAAEEVLISERPDADPTVIEVGRQVVLPLDIHGLPALGPGAKAQVTIGAGERITSAYRFWRETEAGVERRVEPAAAVFDRFPRARLFQGLRGGTAEVTGVRLGYFVDPPTELQRLLRPCWELTGTLRVEGAAPYAFRQFASAVRMPADKPRLRSLRPVG